MGHPDLCPTCRAPISEEQRARMDKATTEQYVETNGWSIPEGPEMRGHDGPSGPMREGADDSTG